MRVCKFIFLFLLLILLMGCWDRQEVEERALVMIIGLDIAEKGMLEITYDIANAAAVDPGGGGGDVGLPSETITFLAPDFVSARDIVNSSVSREISFLHLRVIVVSEELARTEEFIHHFSPVLRDREIRRNVEIIVSQEKAEEFIRNNNPKLEERPYSFFEHMESRWRETSLTPLSILDKFFQRMEEDAGVFLAAYATAEVNPVIEKPTEDEYIAGEFPKLGGNPTQVLGSAVFKKGKMIGVLTGEETRLALALRPDVETDPFLVTYPDPIDEDYKVAFRVHKEQHNRIKMNLKKDVPKINVTIPLTLELLGVPSLINYIEDPNNMEVLKDSITAYLQGKAEALIDRTQEEFMAEPFKWSQVARRQFWTLKEYEGYHWMKSYPKAEISISFEIEISEFGRQLDSLDLQKIRD